MATTYDPNDPNNPAWMAPEAIKARMSLGSELTQRATQPFAPHWSGIVAAGLTGAHGGLERSSAAADLKSNQAMQKSAYERAAAAPDNAAMSKILMGAGVPGLAERGLDVISSERQKAIDRAENAKQREADRRLQFGLQKQQFEHQKRLAMEMKKLETEQMVNQLRSLGILSGDQAPGTVTGQPTPAGPETPLAPGDQSFMNELTSQAGKPEMSGSQKAGIALVLGEKGKAADALMQKGEKLTEGQTKDAMFGERMLRSELNLRKVIPTDEKGQFLKYDPTANVYRFLPDWNITNSSEWQQYKQAAKEGMASLLRKDTGAAISNQEFDLYFPLYWPQPGDNSDVVRQKQQARIQLAKGLRGASGPAFDQMFPKFNDMMRKELTAQGADLRPRDASAGPSVKWTPEDTAEISKLTDGTVFEHPETKTKWVVRNGRPEPYAQRAKPAAANIPNQPASSIGDVVAP